MTFVQNDMRTHVNTS